jgi:1,4-alpha-glucan branching enzyme
MEQPGELALVLHTHMPYVEGFGTWPFGEEWLWEAIATSYVPLLDVLAAPGGEDVTLSITPVLADQLDMAGAVQRCLAFLEEIRPGSHRLDAEELAAAGQAGLAAELARSAAEYAARAHRLRELAAGDGLLAALAPHVSWTSSATHAILPLLASDGGALLQVQSGVASHRRRFGAWHGGFWLPECAHAPWLDELLEDVGVRATCVELTRLYGLGDP